MTTSKKDMERIANYKRTHVKRVALEFQNSYWDGTLKPAIDESGMSTNGFIKKCIEYYLENMGT